MAKYPDPPESFQKFSQDLPELAAAWDRIREAEAKGPLDEKLVRLCKLAIAIGGRRDGAIRSGVRKALAVGATKEEILQVIGLAAGTIGFPTTVAAYSKARELLE